MSEISSLAPSSRYLISLADRLPVMVSLVDMRGRYLFLNKSLARWLGKSRKDVIGQRVDEIVPTVDPMTSDERAKFLKHAIEHPDGIEVEFEVYRGAERRWVRIIYSAHESKMAVFAFIRDITDERRIKEREKDAKVALEEEVRLRGRTLDQIFNLTDDILAILGYDGTFKSVSPSAERVTGVPVDVAVGDKIPYYDFAIEEDRPGLIDVFHRIIGGESITGYEFRVRNIHGGYRWTSWNIRPVPEDNIIILIGRDVTEDKVREDALRQAQKMEAIGQLTGGIAHDFNNLLMGISGSLDLMGRTLDPATFSEVRRYIDGANDSVSRAASLTHRLLAFSRRQPLAPAVIDANALVSGMQSLVERTIGPQVEVIYQPQEDGLWLTVCDPHQLENGLLNLFLNARDAFPDGSGTIVVKTLNLAAADSVKRGIPYGDYVKIVVKDSGCGMDAATMSKAFDPFFTTKPIGQGTGLGLSMLYGFVHQSGGQVRIESETGAGTTVFIYLPRSKAALIPTGEIPEEQTRHRGEGHRILLVEDEPLVRKLIKDVLDGEGYDVIDKHDGHTALEVLTDASEHFDLLITDVGLPGLNGKQVAEISRRTRPYTHVLFITGYAAGVTLRADLLEHGDDMLLKPFTMDALLTKVSELVNGVVQSPQIN